MSLFRPRFGDYKSNGEYLKERQQAERAAEELAKKAKRTQRLESYALVIANLPLLAQYVEKSPIEVPQNGLFRNRYGLVGGWPVGTHTQVWVESNARAEGSRTSYFVVTEDGSFGFAEGDLNRNAYRLNHPLRLNRENFLEYAAYPELGGPGVPDAQNIRGTLEHVLEGTGLVIRES